MKISTAFALVCLSITIMSCEPETPLVDSFPPNPIDSTFISGVSMRFTLNGTSFNSSTQGLGYSCTDTTGITSWGLATGNGLIYDPLTGEWSTGINDTTFLLMFDSPNFGVGPYVIAGPFEVFCWLDVPQMQTIRQYDASQLQVFISRITVDSIFGSYAGPLREMELGLDSLGQLVPIYSGVIDSVSAVFGVIRNPC